MKTKSAIADQSGASHAGFTTRALQARAEHNVQDEFAVMSLRGTSGGTLCAESTQASWAIPDLLQIAALKDRQYHLVGNISIFQSLRILEWLNDFLLNGAFDAKFLRRYHIEEPLKILKAFVGKDDRFYYTPFIKMFPDLQSSLNYESKLDRNSKLINQLVEIGKRQAKKFLELRRTGSPSLNVT